MRRLRRTKIVATLGPSSSDRAVIASLFRAGADVFRINMSHTSHDRMRELMAAIRAVEFEYGRPIGVLVDLQGPKLRVGTFAAGPITLTNGATFQLDSDPEPGDERGTGPELEGFHGSIPFGSGSTSVASPGGDRYLALGAGNAKETRSAP